MEANTVLAQLFDSETVTLPVAKRTVAIKKASLRTLRPILDLVGQVVTDLRLTVDNLPSVNLMDPGLVLKLISKYYDNVVKVVVDHSSVEPDDFLDMDMSDSVLVVQAVIALNKDFFTKKVLPNLQMFTANATSSEASNAAAS